ncbi:MAG: 2-C-methyl-D-erythritol 2,4-cyclodiphosphate synthase [Clostridiales bacterium]|nr:2-C-methyl-D-erythritol 2,4-cyclodiphosphate synthase [Clostridiales bacterium]
MDFKIGIGYDVHRLAENRKLVLGGVHIPCEMGLDGHSDADVAIHALMDSILGALGKGDIGVMFPDTDEKYAGISSVFLLEEVAKLMRSEGYTLSNADMVIIAQNPKLRPFIDSMETIISCALGVEKSKINIKATTEEGLGFTGEGLGIGAKAVCMICRIKTG